MMKCLHIMEHFQDCGHWVDWGNTPDGFKAGDPETIISKIAIAWKPTWQALKKAHTKGAELFITHESICVKTENRSTHPEVMFALESERPIFEWLSKTGMVIYRCHDFWDMYPDLGIRWAWQKRLELDGEIIKDEYPLLVTRIKKMTVGKLAHHVLKRIKRLRQDAVQVTGDLEKTVSKVATGTGVTANPLKMIELGADAGIITDDYYTHVRMGAHVKELDFPTIMVNHGVSEEWGIQNLASYIENIFPEIQVFYLPQYCPYNTIISKPYKS